MPRLLAAAASVFTYSVYLPRPTARCASFHYTDRAARFGEVAESRYRLSSNPPAAIIDAVVHRQIDVGLVWGPLAGYFANSFKVPLRIEAVTPAADPRWPMSFNISMGVRKNNGELLKLINMSLDREQVQIREILQAYHVPLEGR